jgi:hypothetical protein
MEIDKYTKKQQIDTDGIDTANTEFSQIIEKKKKNIREIAILTPLYGNLNLSILSEKGFSNIETLRFVEGYLTTITNIPSTIKKLILNNQLLNKIELPDDLEHLEIENNLFVGEFSLKTQRNLKYVNVSFNQIKSFGKNDLNILPETLEELYCHHNKLQNLYLGTCSKLRILHCDNNDKLKIYDIPDTVIDSRLPEKTIQLVLKETKTKDKNDTENTYLESIQHYFFLKEKYENSLKKMKKMKTKNLPKCNGCKRNVGILFSGKNQKYTASCGDTSKPCDWKITLHRGDNQVFKDTMEEMRNTLENTKENIIRQKMDTLFEYISEEKSADLFKKQLSSFKINLEFVEKYNKMYEDMYFNKEKHEIIQQKKKKIQEKIMEMNEMEEMEEIVKLQMEIKGISEYIQRETYEFMEVSFNPETEEYRLEQENVLFSKLEINHGEPVQVV